ncbi:trifunctional dihydropteroate synthetase [Massospora cicadina]|nr:trifunctional dihydropteroate synthetase [Massospora cicadina]
MDLQNCIIVRGLSSRSIVGGDHWNRFKLQPIVLDLTFFTSIESCGQTDQLVYSVSYPIWLARRSRLLRNGSHGSDLELGEKVCSALLKTYHGHKVSVCIYKPSGLLHAELCGVEVTRTRDSMIPLLSNPVGAAYTLSKAATYLLEDRVFVHKLRVSAIIGIHPWERAAKQIIVVYLNLYPGSRSTSHLKYPQDARAVVTTVSEMIEASEFQTAEALATSIARMVILTCGHPKVTVRVEKPSAIGFAEGAAVEISRDFSSFGSEMVSETDFALAAQVSPAGDGKIALIALGANLGNRCDNISNALRALSKIGCVIIDTSFMYETAPMYIDDQPMFLNAVCKVATSLKPEALLSLLKGIEEWMGRVPTNRNGPRLIDLDILDFEGVVIKTAELELPHPRIAEREFVLRPLCDISPDWDHPQLKRTARQLLTKLSHAQVHSNVVKVLPSPETLDGGEHDTVEKAVAWAQKLVEDGANILDVGGASTRPGAAEVSIDEELSRVIPVIQKLRQVGISCPISIDTFHAKVASEAVLAGANIINDVTGGMHDPSMFEVMASTGVPVCLMHMRGTSKTMCQLNSYPRGQVVQTVQLELKQSLDKAISKGVFRWNLMVDPGLGFAKDCGQNIELLRNLSRLRLSFPCLVGASRKRFLGEITGVKNPRRRGWATAAACTAAIAGGAEILRVHDVAELRDVVLVADAIYRSAH